MIVWAVLSMGVNFFRRDQQRTNQTQRKSNRKFGFPKLETEKFLFIENLVFE